MSKCWYCGEEMTSGNNPEHIGICDKCYQESFEYGNKVIRKVVEEQRNKDQKIADLKVKLAESEKRVKDLEFINKNLTHSLKVAPNANAGQRARIVELKGINHKLKQQLAEITAEANARYDAWQEEIRECDRLRLALADKEKEIDKLEDKLHHYYEEVMNKGTCGLCEHLRGEYKTDFAIEKLELVRNRINYFRYSETKCLNKEDSIEDCLEVLDQQIKELKEKNND